MKIDVDRLGVLALDEASHTLEQLPLRRRGAPQPSAIIFRCSHLVSRDPSVTPTFPSRHPSDRRLREADRLRSGEKLVKSLARHIRKNRHLETLQLLHAPLRVLDWQHISGGLRVNDCRLQHVSLEGSRLGDRGFSSLGLSLLAHPTLSSLCLNGCGLTHTSADMLVRLMQASNLRRKAGRQQAELHAWVGSLRGRTADEDDPRTKGLDRVSLADNSLGEAGAQALAVHLTQDEWLQFLDLRDNGIELPGLKALRVAADSRLLAEEDKLRVFPPLHLSLQGNAPDMHMTRTNGRDPDKTARGTAHRKGPSHLAGSRYGTRLSARQEAHVCVGGEVGSQLDGMAAGEARSCAGAQAVMPEAGRVESLLIRAASGTAPNKRPLTPADWKRILSASGGARPLLDAMDGLIAAALRRVTVQ
jgi:hypothetical protein